MASSTASAEGGISIARPPAPTARALLAEGSSICDTDFEQDIDKATKYGFRFAIPGLLEFIDWRGDDILYHASAYMADATGDDRFTVPKIVQDNMAQNRLRDGQGFLDYEGMDVAAYQKTRLNAFVAMLRHMDKMPAKG
jgi:3-hydroxybutyryl-CoA dehydrogenase